MRAHSANGQHAGFDRTVVPLKLMTSSSESLESRAQARRVAARLHQFQRAEVDFHGLEHVGHSFVDELFRVQTQHPAMQIVPVNMNASIAALVESVRNGL